VERFTIASRGGLRSGGRPGRGAEAGRVGGPGARRYEGRRCAGPMGEVCQADGAEVSRTDGAGVPDVGRRHAGTRTWSGPG